MLYKDCARCKHLWDETTQKGNCRGTAEWWPLNEIWLCRVQTMFLLANFGDYPPDLYESGYTEASHISTRIGANAPYEAESVLWSELSARLWSHGKTGEAGEALLDEVQKQQVQDYKYLSRPAQRALNYISGWRRKLQNYSDWKAHQEKDKSIPYSGAKIAIRT